MHKKISNYLSILTVILLIATSFLPFKSIYSVHQIDNSSKEVEKIESKIHYTTTYSGYESMEFYFAIGLILSIFLIAHFTKEPIKTISVILLALLFYLGLLYTYIISEIGDYELFLSFPIMLVCSSYIIFRSMQHTLKK